MLICFFLVEMTTCFSMKKLAEMKKKRDENIPEEGGVISKRRHLEKKEKDNVVEKPKVILQLVVPSPILPWPHSLS